MKKKYGEITMLDFPEFTRKTFPAFTRWIYGRACLATVTMTVNMFRRR